MAGAGSLKAANFLLYLTSRRRAVDLSTFALPSPRFPLLDNQGIAFDARKFNWLGSPSAEVSVVFAWHTTPFRTLDDIRSREMIVPATGTGANSAIFPRALTWVIGT